MASRSPGRSNCQRPCNSWNKKTPRNGGQRNFPTRISKQEAIVPQRVNLEGDKLRLGLAKLVLTLVEVLRQVLEREALRRMEAETLTADEVERLGMAFMQVKERLNELSGQFGVDHKDLSLDLGAMLGQKSPDNISLVDVIDRLLGKGVAAAGKVTISVADVDLVVLDLLAVLSGITTLQGTSPQKAVRRPD